MIGWSGIWTLPDTAFGRWLILKLVLFGIRLGLAAVNRFRLTPAFAAVRTDPAPMLNHLRRSLIVEFTLSVAILMVVAVMGTLAPPGLIGLTARDSTEGSGCAKRMGLRGPTEVEHD